MDLDVERDFSKEQGETPQSCGASNIVAKPTAFTGRISM